MRRTERTTKSEQRLSEKGAPQPPHRHCHKTVPEDKDNLEHRDRKQRTMVFQSQSPQDGGLAILAVLYGVVGDLRIATTRAEDEDGRRKERMKKKDGKRREKENQLQSERARDASLLTRALRVLPVWFW